ncbi:Protein-tyrosine-phosphatase [Aphelenchoides besseyi]|nr:Protein-tyrosine-phosphatase [Aphelenchoides besseyi]KAI6210627.1 Protein-tyrosine-phosphatase [Aphelenchoides besseyi]
MLDEIIDGVFISDATSVISVRHRERLLELQIGRVLTVSAMPINESDRLSCILYHFIFMMDQPTQDILGDNVLENGIAIIENAVRDGIKIVVHCEAGVSRSVAVVAAYLMRRFEWSTQKAIYFIQEKRPNACPNSSFIRQLDIFAHLGWNATPESLVSSPLYRNFTADMGILPKIANRRQSDEDPSASTSTHLNGRTSRDHPRGQLDQKSPHAIAAQHRFRCRRCRTDLFYDTHILYHARESTGTAGMTAAEETNFDYVVNDRCEFEYFITPMKWMRIDEYAGKINCPKCHEKLGQYSWGGKRCSGLESSRCGTHVSPWFYIQKNKVDKSTANPMVTNAANIQVVIS